MLARWLALRGRRLRCSWSAHSGGLTAARCLPPPECPDRVTKGSCQNVPLRLMKSWWAKHPAPYPPCGGRFPSTRPQTVLTCLHVYGFPLVTLLFTIVLNHRVAVLTDNQCLAMSFEHQFLPLIIAFQLGESPHMMHDYFSFLTT